MTRPLVVALTGASGLVGSALTAFLTTGGHRVIRLVRRAATTAEEREWDPAAPAEGLLRGVDAVVHLAGASIAAGSPNGTRRPSATAASNPPVGWPQRPRPRKTARPYSSALRPSATTGTTGAIRHWARTVRAAPAFWPTWSPTGRPRRRPPPTRCAGGVGAHRDRAGCSRGTLKLLRPLFFAGVGGRLGSGRQWLSWIGLDDLTDIYYRALYDARLSGPVNAVSPVPVRNSDYTKALAHLLRRPAALPVPSLAPRILLASKALANSAKPTSGCCRQGCKSWVTGSVTPRCSRRWLTSSGTMPTEVNDEGEMRCLVTGRRDTLVLVWCRGF
ncbi:NAD dependent epimerase/dehydratase family protein [Mycobacterium xenopi 3993]|nr:NAD dependent epimerase/dehydratase family protein [Mycobacterium xenopi 3993]